MVTYIRFSWKSVRSGEFNHLAFVRKFNDTVASDFLFVMPHSRREDTRGPVRNGASRRQSLIVRFYN
jgi:hypothetical protein